MKNKKQNSNNSKALVITGLNLTKNQAKKINIPTPKEFIKERKARGGKIVKYVEGGYIISLLNEIFGPLNWEFKIVREEVTDKDISVYGELTIIDHINGYKVTKGHGGSKERYAGVPLGDTKKAAYTDCLKKIASLFGIALDVYWQQLDDDRDIKQEKTGTKMNEEQIFQASVERINNENNKNILREWKDRIMKSRLQQKYKDRLIELINHKLGNEG